MLLGLSHGSRPSSSLSLALACLFVLSQLTSVVIGLRTTPGSPCESTCHRVATNTSSSEIVCMDREYNTTTKGRTFQSCVECQLGSTYSNPESGESDVTWGLYNIRYAFDTCLYGFPQQMYNISSPCVVSCSSLEPALDQNLIDPDIANEFQWCRDNAFADVVVDQCSDCYNLTTNQAYLANFVESIRYNCHFRTPSGTAFPIKASDIFTQVELPSSSVNLLNPPKGHSVNLKVAIAVPIVCFVVIVALIAGCCLFFCRHRRKKARKQEVQDQLDKFYAMNTPMGGPWTQYQMQPGADGAMMAPAAEYGYPYGNGYGYGPGVGFVDNDGQGQNVGFVKSDFAMPAPGAGTPAVAVTTTASSSSDQEEREKGKESQPDFPPPPGAPQPRNES